MRYIVDHDLHLHSKVSLCSNDPGQTPEALLKYGEENGFSTLCMTNHMWDATIPGASGWYQLQPYEHICKEIPLPQAEGTRFLFGCETDMDRYGTVGCSRELMDKMEFVIIPTTHMHMAGFTVNGDEGPEERATLWCSKFNTLLNMDMPFYKIGIAHLTCCLINYPNYLATLQHIKIDDYHRLFAKAAHKGIGIELNFPSLERAPEDLEIELLPYRIAKEEGCKFYFGSDAHHPQDLLRARENFENIVDLLHLTEDDKIPFLKA